MTVINLNRGDNARSSPAVEQSGFDLIKSNETACKFFSLHTYEEAHTTRYQKEN